MSERYYLTGVQLGMLRAFIEQGITIEALEILRNIEGSQFVGNISEDEKNKKEVGVIDKHIKFEIDKDYAKTSERGTKE